MKFVPLRDIRNHPRSVLNQLKKEKEIILTSHGKPVALISKLEEESFESDLASYRKGRGKTISTHAAEPAASYTVDDPEILQAWIDEAERRYDDYLKGKVKLIPAHKVLADLRKRLK
jgi:prevent-host-death family protein